MVPTWSQSLKSAVPIARPPDRGFITLHLRVKATAPVPFFRCPGVVNNVLCDRRVAKLYARSHYFLCRHCYQLAYPSQNVSVADRPLTRAQDIRRQLGGSANLLVPFPMKPKNMHWMRYWRLQDRATKAEVEALTIMQRWLDRHTNILAQAAA